MKVALLLVFALVGCESEPKPVPEPVIQGVSDLLGRPLGRLDWGANPKTGNAWLARDLREMVTGPVDGERTPALREVLQEAKDSLALAFQPVSTIEMEGLLDSDPRMQASTAAVNQLIHLPALALCSRIGSGDDAIACRIKVDAAVRSWTRTNRPSGSPINDSKLVPLIEAVDVTLDGMSAPEVRTARAWLRQVIDRGDEYYASRPPLPPGKPTGNYMSWHLGLRALSAAVLTDAALLQETADRLQKHLAVNINDDGSTYDFRSRDALHYHLYDLQPLVLAALFAPASFTSTAIARLQNAVNFLRPFYTGQQVHLEFQHSTSPFDKTRRDAGQGEYANAAWLPAKANICLFRSRILFPEIRPWTASAVNGVKAPMERAIYALKTGGKA